MLATIAEDELRLIDVRKFCIEIAMGLGPDMSGAVGITIERAKQLERYMLSDSNACNPQS